MMKLGSQTGSLMNHVYSRFEAPLPMVGMGATLLAWSDRYAATVIEVTDKVIAVREDRAIRTDSHGLSECQEYRYEPYPDGRVLYFHPARNGGWNQVRLNPETGRWNQVAGYGLLLGERRAYHDFSF